MRVTPLFKRPKRVVLAEDDEHLRALWTESISEAGFEVVVCRDGGELEATLHELFDNDDQDLAAIVAGNRMNRHQGIEILRGVRKARRDVPFILISATADEEIAAEARQLGAIALTKPFDVDDLVALVGGCLEGTDRD